MALTKTDLTAIGAVVAAAFEAALVNTLAAAQPVVSAPAKGKVATKTWATKAEREAGHGFACSCGRTNLRVTPHKGSFHKAPDGTTHTV